jgi:hypothetical protein
VPRRAASGLTNRSLLAGRAVGVNASAATLVAAEVTSGRFHCASCGASLPLGLGWVAVAGAVLTLGLIRPWGEVYPRWLPLVGGRRVPPALAIVPAALVAAPLFAAGLTIARLWPPVRAVRLLRSGVEVPSRALWIVDSIEQRRSTRAARVGHPRPRRSMALKPIGTTCCVRRARGGGRQGLQSRPARRTFRREGARPSGPIGAGALAPTSREVASAAAGPVCLEAALLPSHAAGLGAWPSWRPAVARVDPARAARAYSAFHAHALPP